MRQWVVRTAIRVRSPARVDEFVVEDTIHLLGGKIGHVGYMAEGMIKDGDTVTLTVDEAYRREYL